MGLVNLFSFRCSTRVVFQENNSVMYLNLQQFVEGRKLCWIKHTALKSQPHLLPHFTCSLDVYLGLFTHLY